MVKKLNHIPLSILDLSPIVEGSTPSIALNNTRDLAQHAEQWGYKRYWIAEHHSMPGIASSATGIVIAHVASGTSTIRVGSGGIMLPNHAPLIIAEQFGTLESLFPGRVDLGLGRAPGTDQLTTQALRRDLRRGEDFPEQLYELMSYLDEPQTSNLKRVRAIPGEGTNIPIWLLGSSQYSAKLAGKLGLPFAFASHFSPRHMMPALETYRKSFVPSEELKTPYAMVAVNILAADTKAEAEFLSTSHKLQFLNIIRGKTGQLTQPPVDSMEGLWSSHEKVVVEEQLKTSIIGGPEDVQKQLEAFINKTNADELMIHTSTYDHKARLHSYKLVSDIIKTINSNT